MSGVGCDECYFANGKECAILIHKECVNCNFRKTEQEVKAGRKRAEKLLLRLPAVKRAKLINKYVMRFRFNEEDDDE